MANAFEIYTANGWSLACWNMFFCFQRYFQLFEFKVFKHFPASIVFEFFPDQAQHGGELRASLYANSNDMAADPNIRRAIQNVTWIWLDAVNNIKQRMSKICGFIRWSI